jgi:hypothetical protein
VVSFMLRLLYHLPGEKALGTHDIRDWVGLRAGMEAVDNRTLAVHLVTCRYTDGANAPVR